MTIHPGAQAVLADVMVEATHRTQVLVTTHSPDLIDRLPIESLRAVPNRRRLHQGWPRVGLAGDSRAGWSLHLRGTAQHGGTAATRMTTAAPGIVPIVEGPGDRDAAPILLRRVLYEQMGVSIDVKLPKKATDRGALIKRLEKFLAHARNTPGCKAILVLLDSDKDCPKKLGAELARRARAAAIGLPIAVVCAKREYENWFLAGDKDFTGEVEEFGGAKVWLTNRMPPGLAYKETTDQPSLSATMDIEAAFQASRSFRRLCSAMEELVDGIDSGTVSVTPCP